MKTRLFIVFICKCIQRVVTSQYLSRQGSQLHRVDVCAFEPDSLVYQAFQKSRRSCERRLIGTWHHVVTSFAPESIISPDLPETPAWHFTWLKIPHWDYISHIFHTLGTRGVDVEMMLLSSMILVFTKLIVLSGHDAWGTLRSMKRDLVEEATDEASTLFAKSDQWMNYVATIWTDTRVADFAVSIFGMMQWLSTVLSFQRRRELRPPGQMRPCRPYRPGNAGDAGNTSTGRLWRPILEHLFLCLRNRQLFEGDHTAKPLAWILTMGRLHWGPLHMAMAEAADLEPYLLSFPSIELPQLPQLDPNHAPLVELCATAQQQEQLRKLAIQNPALLPSETTLASALQHDGVRITVVAVATGLPNAADPSGPLSNQSRYLLEFLVWAEKPHGECARSGACREKNRTLYTCGPHAAILPEVSMRRWRCIFRASPASTQSAHAVNFFRQAATIRCPIPADLSLTSRGGPLLVELEADPPYEGAVRWRIAVEVCSKGSDAGGSDVDSGGDFSRLAICIQPAWDMRDLETGVPRLVQTFLRYYQLLGADGFTFYDYDASFARHPDVLDLLAAGKLKYFPNFMKGVSELLDEAWKSKIVKGLTGSRASFMQELTLNHCVLNYRGAADLVLLGDKDVFLAFGPSVPAFPTGCWQDAGTTAACCSGTGPNATRVLYHGPTECWHGFRTFAKCCLEYSPEAPTRSPWPDFIRSRPVRFWKSVGTVAMGVCEFAVPSYLPRAQRGPNWSFSSHIWRPRDCNAQYYHLVNPWRFMSQNSEWVRLRPRSVRYYVDPEALRAMHLVNLHKERCTERVNLYGSARQPCNWPDFGLRWAAPGLRSSELEARNCMLAGQGSPARTWLGFMRHGALQKQYLNPEDAA